ncbi:LamG domain-containing protein [Candidatus Poribacteria bacterium]|nr:LamG domain-containing protein [Candidatus Poribacteria bacterium]
MKIVFLTLAIAMLLAPSLGYARLDEALVLYYPFDEVKVDAVKDASPNKNDGVIKGTAKLVDGKFDKAIDLPSASFVEMQASDTLTGDLFKDGAFTIYAWINPSFAGSTWEHIWRSLPGPPKGHNTFFLNLDGRLSWRASVGGTWTVLCETAPGLVPKGEWTNVVVLGDTKNFKIFVNGKEAMKCEYKKTDGGNATYHFGGEGGESYAGAIDEAAVFSRALSEDEINKYLGGIKAAAVVPKGKLTAIWGTLKTGF